ncbi:MAG: hypothetical protein RLZZ393_2301 [Pseudomonadota bacterium]|jgi:hypothetical protein
MPMLTRRTLLVSAGGLAAGHSLRPADAADAGPRPLLAATEPAAVAIGYVESAAKVDARANPSWRRGQSCATCALIEFGTGRARGCSAVPGRLVLATGWCKAWRLRGA